MSGGGWGPGFGPGSASSGSSGGWGPGFGSAPASSTPPPKKAGGILGTLENVGKAVAHPFQQAGHYIAQQGVNTGEGLYGIGTGIYTLGKSEGQTLYNDIRGRNNKLNQKEWSDLFHGHIIRMFQEAGKMKGQNSPEAQLAAIDKAATVDYPGQIAQVVEHPQKNLFQDVVTLAPLAGASAGTVGRAADAAAVAKMSNAELAAYAGEHASRIATVAQTVVRGTEPGVRTLNVPGNRLEPPARYPVGPNGERLPGPGQVVVDGKPLEGPAKVVPNTTQVQLNQGRSYLSRAGAKAHDVLAQKALNTTADALATNPGRPTPIIAKYAMARGAKSLEESANITSNVRGIQVADLAKAPIDASLSPEEASLATVLHAGNVLPEEMSKVWRQAAADGVVRVPQPDGSVISSSVQPIDRQRMLAAADLADKLAAKGALRLDKTGGAVEVNGEQFPMLHTAQQLVQGASDTRETAILATNPRMTSEALQSRKNLTARVAGVDRQGSAFVSLKPFDKAAQPASGIARIGGRNTVPQTKGISLGEHATGVGLAKGHIPADATREVASGLRIANRVRATNDLRGALAAHGHDVRMTRDDWLVAKDLPSKVDKLPDEMKVLLGKLRDTGLSPEEEHAAVSKWNQFVTEHLVNRAPAGDVGQAAPEGWKWVHKSLVPDSLKHNATARGPIEKQFAKLSTGVTAATVYFKPGHIPQRLATNAAAVALHGSLLPGIRASLHDMILGASDSRATLQSLTKTDRHRLAAATGTHGYESLPIEGTGRIARAAAFGARGYAKYVDAFFRQNAALYELRKIGYDTPEKVSKALDAVENGGKLPGHELMKINGALRRANRESMDYETNALEKRTIQRALWFYGFSKAATRFAGHTVIEHPGKTGVLGVLGQQGQKEQQQQLGPVPSFEGGLTPISGGKYPLTVDLSTLIPSGTVAREAQAVQHPLGQEGIQSFLNPVYAGAEAVAQGKGAKGFFTQAFAPTPELQALTAASSPRRTGGSFLFPTSSQNLFGRTWGSALLRSVAGAAVTPRRVNRAKLNQDAAREHQKKRTITIYQP